MNQEIFKEFREKLDKIIGFIKNEIISIRTGKASPSIIESLVVEAYGGTAKLKLMELSSIMTEGPSALLISPFDPATLVEIEKAILKSPLNLTPRIDKHQIHIKIPALSEEQRKQLLKVVAIKIEEGKIQIRASRDDLRRKIKAQFESKEITEDDKYRIEKEIDKIIQDYNNMIETIKEKKEKEMMQI